MQDAFYKGNRFLHNACVRVEVTEESAIDSGGVRRQFYFKVFAAIANGSLDGRLRLKVKPSNIASGLLKIFGTAVARALVMDHAAFPFFTILSWSGRCCSNIVVGP